MPSTDAIAEAHEPASIFGPDPPSVRSVRPEPDHDESASENSSRHSSPDSDGDVSPTAKDEQDGDTNHGRRRLADHIRSTDSRLMKIATKARRPFGGKMTTRGRIDVARDGRPGTAKARRFTVAARRRRAGNAGPRIGGLPDPATIEMTSRLGWPKAAEIDGNIDEKTAPCVLAKLDSDGNIDALVHQMTEAGESVPPRLQYRSHDHKDIVGFNPFGFVYAIALNDIHLAHPYKHCGSWNDIKNVLVARMAELDEWREYGSAETTGASDEKYTLVRSYVCEGRKEESGGQAHMLEAEEEEQEYSEEGIACNDEEYLGDEMVSGLTEI